MNTNIPDPLALTQAPTDTEAIRQAVDSLEPTINNALNSMGAGKDPYLKSQARLLAADAIRSFDPDKGTNIKTWVSRSLQPIRRMRRESQTPIQVPESIQLDAYHIMAKENEFLDKNDREPTVEELADLTSLPIKRISKVRKSMAPVSSEQTYENFLPGAPPDYVDEALDYVYRDLGRVDKKILEYKTGYGGSPVLNGAEIAKRLNIPPAQVSRRSANLAMKIYDIEKALEGVTQ